MLSLKGKSFLSEPIDKLQRQQSKTSIERGQ